MILRVKKNRIWAAGHRLWWNLAARAAPLLPGLSPILDRLRDGHVLVMPLDAVGQAFINWAATVPGWGYVQHPLIFEELGPADEAVLAAKLPPDDELRRHFEYETKGG